VEWVFNWPSGMLREQNLLRLSRSELFTLEKDFSAYVTLVEAKHGKKPPKPRVSTSLRPRKNAKKAPPLNLDRICVDAVHDYKVIDQRLKKMVALGKNGRTVLPRSF
jgi:hypothetical protein